MVNNGAETDIDCGGGVCLGCDLGKTCSLNADCTSNICVSSVCVDALCGDGLVTGAEICDDGNATGGDGCSSMCTPETGFTCSGVMPTVCTPICNDNMVVPGEGCDDGNATDGDGCSAMCAVELGYSCMGSPSACTSRCGDGIVLLGETCDDGNQFGGDGCGTTCLLETGFTCTGSPNICTAICGDSMIVGFEECDDGNMNANDGCNAACNVEANFACTGVPSVCYRIELEPNGTCNDASGPFTPPFVIRGRIVPIADQDYIRFTVPAHADLKIESFAPTVGVCPSVDNVIELRDSACTVLATDDQDGINSCALISSTLDSGAKNVPPGTYYVRVEDWLNNGVIDEYQIEVTYNALCGNGVVEGSETCDDGNLTSGDGCALNCRIEPEPELEPNDICGQATGPFALPELLGGSISPVADKDLFAFTIPAYADIKVQTFAPGFDTCTTGVDTVVQLRATDCTTVITTNDNGGVGTCSLIDSATNTAATNLAPGTYYVHVEENGNNAAITNYELLISINALCGDGLRQGSETCDDGNTNNNDGCANNCRIEQGWTCSTGTPNVCAFNCGDGTKTGSEQCDDGDTMSGDGCSDVCVIEDGYVCNGTPSMCTLIENICNDGIDNDGDTFTDATDPDCMIPAYFPACSAGQILKIYRSIDVPKAIPDSPLPGVTSNLFVSAGAGTIARAAMLYNITHTYDSDLDLTLIPPSGTNLDVCSDNGIGGDNFTNTVLDSTCMASVTTGAAPFAGCFQPETSFSSLVGTSAAGNWKFFAADDAGSDAGTINSWAMIFCIAP